MDMCIVSPFSARSLSHAGTVKSPCRGGCEEGEEGLEKERQKESEESLEVRR